MAIWVSTFVLVLVLTRIVISEVRCGRRSKAKLSETNLRIDELAKTTFNRHRELFGRDATGTFTIPDVADVKK